MAFDLSGEGPQQPFSLSARPRRDRARAVARRVSDNDDRPLPSKRHHITTLNESQYCSVSEDPRALAERKGSQKEPQLAPFEEAH